MATGSPVGLQQIARFQGLQWGDSGRSGGDSHIWYDAGGWNADSLMNMNAGFAVAPPNGTGTNAGFIPLGSMTNTLTVPDNTTTINLLNIKQQFAGTTNAPSGNSARLINGESHWVDAVNDVATVAGGYFWGINDAVTDTQDLIGVIGRAQITTTGKSSVGMWGVRGDVNFGGAAVTVTSAAGVIGHQGSWAGAAAITTYSQLQASSLNCSTGGAVVQNGFGVNVAVPVNAVVYNAGVSIGTIVAATGPYTVGLIVHTNGAWFRGNATLPVHADTSSTPCIIALMAGDNAAANNTNVLTYYYRGSAALGFIGFDTNVSQVAAGHTKALTDLVLGSDKCVVDTNGQIFSANQIASNSYLIQPAVKTSGTIGTSFTYTGAAHTGLTAGSFAEFNFNAARTVTFDGTGSPTIATAYNFQFQRPTYTSSTATMAFTNAATVRITGQPIASAAGGFTPTFTVGPWSLYVDVGSSFFAGAVVQGHATAAINSTATATAAQAATGYITSTSAAPTTITLPTGTALGAVLGAVQGTIHDLYIDNTAGASTVTIAVAVNGILSADAAANAGNVGLLTVPSGVTGQAHFRLMFSSATAYTFSREG